MTVAHTVARNGVLVLRPAESAVRTAAAIGGLGRVPVLMPLARIVDTEDPIPLGDYDAVAFTSAAAVRVVSGRRDGAKTSLLAIPAICVGEATAAAARAAGWREAVSAEGDADALAGLLAHRFEGRDAKILYLCGRDRAFDLSAALSPRGIAIAEIAIYAAELVDPPCQELKDKVRICDSALLHSARTARHFFTNAKRCDADLSKLTMLAISETVAAAIPAELRSAARVAAHPDEPAMLALLERGSDSDPDMKQ